MSCIQLRSSQKKSEWYQKIKRTKMYLRILPRNPAATLKTYQQKPATTTKPRSLWIGTLHERLKQHHKFYDVTQLAHDHEGYNKYEKDPSIWLYLLLSINSSMRPFTYEIQTGKWVGYPKNNPIFLDVIYEWILQGFSKRRPQVVWKCCVCVASAGRKTQFFTPFSHNLGPTY